MAEVARADPAETDLEEIAFFIGVERGSPKAADRLLDAFRKKAEAYGRQPGMGTLHEELRSPVGAGPMRSFRVKSYVAFSVEIGSSILVLRVVHGSRNFPSLFRG